MRQVITKRDGATVKMSEMFSGPGSGYELVPEYFPLTMPAIRFEVTLEDGFTIETDDWKFCREELCLSDDDADYLLSYARAARLAGGVA